MNSLMLYITLRQYEYVVAVADLGSLTEAAAHLNVSQTIAVGLRSRVSSSGWGPVFLREPVVRRSRSRRFGHKFVAQARSLLALATQVERGPEVAVPFVLGCFEDIAPWYLGPCLGGASRAFTFDKSARARGTFLRRLPRKWLKGVLMLRSHMTSGSMVISSAAKSCRFHPLPFWRQITLWQSGPL